MCRRNSNLLFFFLSLHLLSAFPLLASPSPNPNVDDFNDRPSTAAPEWQILTKRNFSSQIRSHRHILLLVTLPWSGESRSLKKDVARLVSANKEKLDDMRLMVVYKNSEKMLADILGAKDELTLFYYHHSKRFKYQGKINARSIVESFVHLMSFQPGVAPLEFLDTDEKLKNFLKSTDEAVLLLEFCGWSARVSRNRDVESTESYHSAPCLTENGDVIGENITIDNVPNPLSENEKLKGPENGNIFCGAEDGPFGHPWIRGISWDMENFPLGEEHGKFNCNRDEFKRFESFFSNFTIVVRETFLPPERLRFGHISDSSLLPLLGIEKPNSWMLLHWVSGCSDCSEFFQQGDDLRNFVQMHHSLIVDLDSDRSTLDFAFPANQPSIILFIDSWSEFPKVREASKNALDIFRRFVHETQPFGQQFKGHLGANTGISMHDNNRDMRQGVSDVQHSFPYLFSGNKNIKLNDKMTFMVVNEDGRVSLGNTIDSSENSVYDLLTHFLQQSDPVQKKTKFSLIAKKAGFNLLSDDFEVKDIDSHTHHNEFGQVGWEMQNVLSQLDGTASDSHLDRTKDDHHAGSAAVDADKIESVMSQLDPDEQLREATCKVRSMDFFKDEKSSCEMDTSLTNCHSGSSSGVLTSRNIPGSSFDDTHGFFAAENNPGREHIHHEDGKSGELNVSGDDKKSIRDPITDASAPKVEVQASMKLEMLKEKHNWDHQFEGSYFVADGGYRVLRALMGEVKLPSVVILHPVMHHHYVLPDATNLSYATLGSFIYNFSKGYLYPHERSEFDISRPKANPQPPFVNLDFHEAASVPRVTADSFSELVLGCSHSNCRGNFSCFKDQIRTYTATRDVLVLFTNSWCGFCQRMELVVREVYRACQGLSSMSKSRRMIRDLEGKQGDAENVSLNQLHSEDTPSNPFPSIYHMDCTLNDCTFYLEYLQKREVYPTLVLFPAGKDAIVYEGDISVNGIFDFTAAYGSSTQNLGNEYRGILWTPRGKRSKSDEANDGMSPITLPDVVAGEDRPHEQLTCHPADAAKKHDSDSQLLEVAHTNMPHILVGSILSATAKLANAIPFDNSSILIVRADQNTGFQGIILNKRISWSVFIDMDVSLSALNEAALSYGGPVRALKLPLVSLSGKALQGYSEVTAGVYYGDPVATSIVVDGIRSGNLSASGFWFFLGFSGWDWNQLYGEIARGDWDPSEAPVKNIQWPEV